MSLPRLSPPPLPPLLARLQSWSAINSGSDHLAGLARMADGLEAALRELTPDVTRVPLDDSGRVALRARMRPAAHHRILCSGHYDTVFGADHPFQKATLHEDTGRLNGPGVADMKGGLVVMMAALAAFEQTPAAKQIGWTVLLTPDEETGSIVSAPEIEAAAASHHLGLVFEPARETGALVKSRSATAVFRAEVHGRAAHAGRNPEDGRNAITALAQFCLDVEAFPESIPDTLVNVGNIQGGAATNIVPDHAVAEVNARASTSAGVEALESAFQAAAESLNAREGYTMSLTGGFHRHPLQVTPLRESLFANLSQCSTDLGHGALEWEHVSGGSDGNLLHAAGLPVLDGMGPIGGGLHSDREYIETASLASRAQIAATFLNRLASGEITLQPA